MLNVHLTSTHGVSPMSSGATSHIGSSAHSPLSFPKSLSRTEAEILRECTEIFEGYSPIERSRLLYHPRLPQILSNEFHLVPGQKTSAHADAEEIKQLFPHTFGQRAVHFKPGPKSSKSEELPKIAPPPRNSSNEGLRVGVLFSGGPAPAGHNVITALWDSLKAISPHSKLFGFIDGPSGLINSKYVELDARTIDAYRNQGGFHMIGSGRTKISSKQQFQSSLATVNGLDLNGLVIIGGDDSNTNAAQLAEYFCKHRSPCVVNGVPKTIDGDLKNEYIECSFGFDTATKVYAEQVAALAADAVSARKSWHFCRLMGRSASSVTLEVALQTHPNIVLIGEDLKARGGTLTQVTEEICDIIARRAEAGLNHGVLILPEGIIEWLPDVNKLVTELNELAATCGNLTASDVSQKLRPESSALFESLPLAISSQLLLDRDDHGNVQVSKIESERLLASLVETEMNKRKKNKQYKGKLSIVCHFLGYEGRCGLPSNFDSNYCYTLGTVVCALIDNRCTGMLAIANRLHQPTEMWTVGGQPITHMMNMERRSGKSKPVIKKALVDLSGRPFLLLSSVRDNWKLVDDYRNPGSIQFFGPFANCVTATLAIEQFGKEEQEQYKHEDEAQTELLGKRRNQRSKL